jgi:F420-dependent oxidoreductase-like protein
MTPMPTRVPCHVFVPQTAMTYADLRAIAAASEALTYDGLWVVDHMWGRGSPDAPFLDGWGLVTALAQATHRIRLGVLVSCNSYRNPGLLAKSAVTADHVSGGRVDLGVGAGWMEEEYAAYGFEFPPMLTRLAQLAESLAIITSLFGNQRTTFRGCHYRFEQAPFEPKPVQKPLPITIGGSGPKVLMKLVAQHAQRWNCPMPAAARLAEHIHALNRHCDAVGRDPREIAVSEQIAVVVAQDDARLRERVAVARERIGGFVDIDQMAICGTPQAVVDALNDKVRRGVDDFAILFGDPSCRDDLELFAERVAPHLTRA